MNFVYYLRMGNRVGKSNAMQRATEIIERINLDASPSPSRKLHPTLKKCACGWIGTKHQFYNHIDEMEATYSSAKDFWTEHGEVLLHEDEV